MLRLIAIAAAIWSVMMIAVSDRGQPPAPVPDAVAERWPDDPPAAPKADRLRLAVAAEDFPAEIVAAARVEPVATIAHLPAPPTTRKRDICRRHGLHKVATRGGKSWRCRRGA